MNLPFFIAGRIFRSDSTNKTQISLPAIKIATIGVAIGLAVMIVSVCVVLGFKHSVQQKVSGFAGDIQIAEFNTLQTTEQYPIAVPLERLTKINQLDGVAHAQRYALKEGILKTDEDFLGVQFKGVAEEYDSTFLHRCMKAGSIPVFSAKNSSNKILVSQTMADKLHLKVGDKIFAYFIGDQGVRTRKFSVSGIYETNLSMFDGTTVLTDLSTVSKLNGWKTNQVSGVEVNCIPQKQMVAEQQIIEYVNRQMDEYGNTFSSKTTREINPQIFAWLDLLDMNIWIILALMTAVSVVTMISGLLILILEHTNMIGLLKALGTKNSTIRQTFLWFSVFIVGRGLLIGNLLGVGLVLLQLYCGVVRLNPATYYVDRVPVELNGWLILLLNVGTLLISVLMLIAPSYLISYIHPAKSMKYE